MKQLISIGLLAISCCDLFAQVEVVHSIHRNSQLQISSTNKQIQARRVATDTLQLPFQDDFSNKDVYPDSSKWLDNYVFINNTYPINKLSYGVATFDGLNQYGIPYSDSLLDVITSGADTLTSKPINLGSVIVGDSTYFSFSFEPQGLGDYPDYGDSLILEFKINDSTWTKVWGHDGYATPLNNPVFIDVYLLMDTMQNASFFFSNGFQFRFRNIATVIGNDNHWHIDYVYLNTHRTAYDPFRKDLTFIDAPNNFLRNYRAMPWGHFYNNQAQEIGDTISFCVTNYFNNPLSPKITFDVHEVKSQAVIPSSFAGGFTLNSLATQCFSESDHSLFTPFVFTPVNTDSVTLRVRTYVDQAPGDLYSGNDSVYTDVHFEDYFAYDDGSAEKAYGLAGSGGLKQFAYEFHLNHPDTLRAILIHFTKIDYDPSKQLFSLYVWKNIDLNNAGTGDDTLYHEDFRNPLYVDTLNGFAIFNIKNLVLVSDSFYVGWQQTGDKNIEVGLDLNNDAHAHMSYYANATWFPSLISGAPMIRPVVGKDKHLVDTYVNDIKDAKQTFTTYPNPASNLLTTTFNTNLSTIHYEVYDLAGQIISQQPYHNQSIDIKSLNSGFYMLRFFNDTEPITEVARFVKM